MKNTPDTHVVLKLITSLAIVLVVTDRAQADPESREFSIHYVSHVRDVPKGIKKLRLWVPVPKSNAQQTISNLRFQGGHKPVITTEPKFKNKMAYYEVDNPTATFDLIMTFDVKRIEDKSSNATIDKDKRVYLTATKLMPKTDDIRTKALSIVSGKTTSAQKGRALYDFVLKEMTYDKSGTGWGRGDFRYASATGCGNCTDFHSYFIGLCRNLGVPAYFEVGLSVPNKPGKNRWISLLGLFLGWPRLGARRYLRSRQAPGEGRILL